MQRLDHPNIVKYIDTIRSSSYLYIALEYMESGSLSSVVKAFGCDEARSALYISQVLKGLKYLHNQGVLHRDLKAANILTNKKGNVKLADFGVAIKLSSESNNDDIPILGSPFWMAPEIIEMNPPTSACDIWSIGCIVIELLTGSPPYFHLPAPAALYRIATDVHPPLPDSISPALQDFIMLCFHKEPAMRATAAKLLEHPWITNYVKTSLNKEITMVNHHASKISSEIDQSASNLFETDEDEDHRKDRNLRALSYDSYAQVRQRGGSISSFQASINPSTPRTNLSSIAVSNLSSPTSFNANSNTNPNTTTNSNTAKPTIYQYPQDLIVSEHAHSDTEFNFDVSRSNTQDDERRKHEEDEEDASNNTSLIIDDDDFDSVFEFKTSSAHPPHASSTSTNSNINNNSNSIKTGRIKSLVAYQDDEDDINENDFADISLSKHDKSLSSPYQSSHQSDISKGLNSGFISNSNYSQSVGKPHGILTSASFSKQKLDETLKRNTVEDIDGSFDQFHFDDADFIESEPSFIPIRRSREIVEMMGKIKNCLNEADLNEIGSKIIEFFENPEQRKNFVICHGVMSVIDMYEPKTNSINPLASPTFNPPTRGNGTAGGSSNVFFSDNSPIPNNPRNSLTTVLYNTIPSRVYINMVLRITNKLIEEPLAQEQLAYLGLIPIIMSIFEKSCMLKDTYKTMIPFTPRDNNSSHSPTTSSPSSGTVSRSNNSPKSRNSPMNLSSPSPTFVTSTSSSVSSLPPPVPSSQLNNEFYKSSSSATSTSSIIEDLTLESVKFIYQISLLPSLLKLLIGAGGLNVITTMVSFHSKLETDKVLAELQNSLNEFKGITSPDGSFTPELTPNLSSSNTLNTSPQNTTKLKVPSLKLDLNEISSSSRNLPPLPSSGNNTSSISSDINDSRCISIFQMGLSSVNRVLTQSTRPRDFFRLFVKIGLMTHLFESLDTFLCRYRSLLTTKIWSFKMLEKVIKQQQEIVAVKFNKKHSTSLLFSTSNSTPSNSSPAPLTTSTTSPIPMFSTSPSPTSATASVSTHVDDIIASFGDVIDIEDEDEEDPLNDFDSDFEDEVFNLNQYNSENFSYSPYLPAEFNTKFCLQQYKLNNLLYSCEQFITDLVYLIFKFSRSDGVVAENIVKSNEGSNIKIILNSIENLRENFSLVNQLDQLQDSILNELGWNQISTSSSFNISTSHHNSSLNSIYSSQSKQFQLNNKNSNMKKDLKSVVTSSSSPQSLHTYLTLSHSLSSNSSTSQGSTLSPVQNILDFLMKSIRLLTLEPSTLDDLDALGTTDKLVELFIEINTTHSARSNNTSTTSQPSNIISTPSYSTKFLPEALNHQILPTLFHLLRLHPRRQEKAALLGIVSPLIHTIITDSSSSSLLRQFALPILNELTRASNISRQALLNNNVVNKFCEWLTREEVYWQKFALNSLSIWISHDMERVSRLLILPQNLTKLIEFFHTVSNSTLSSLHKPLLDMHKSSILCESLSVSGIYINALVRRLNTTSEAMVRRSLLRIVQYLHQHHSISSRQYILNYNLYIVVKNLSKLDDQVLVSELANRLLTDFQFSTLT